MQKEWIENAIERAKLFGMLNYYPGGELNHIPFSLSPFPISKSELKKTTKLTTYFNKLILNVSQNWDFLEEHLSPIAQNDPFLKLLLDLRINELTQSKQLLIQRNDFFLLNERQNNEGKTKNNEKDKSSESKIQQVEINTVAVSFPFLITQLCRLHQYLFENDRLDAIVNNNPLKKVADSFAITHKAYGHKNSIILLVTQTYESNRFDQIGLEHLLWDIYKIKTVRKSLSEIYKNCFLRNGHLILDGQIVSITYFRTGYSPNDFYEEDAIKGRKLIENSSTIQVPNLTIQLAGMKKIQQVLTKPKIISKFVSQDIAKIIIKTFVKMYSLDEVIVTSEGKIKASEFAYNNHNSFVLKPQREGGGNNFFGVDIKKLISEIKDKELNTYVLMERIRPKTHSAILVVKNNAESQSCISEIGRYGICSSENGSIINNFDAGYLVRTKSESINEGGVCSGFACLNSLKIE